MTACKNPRLLVLCGPSGSGKSTLLKKIMQDYPNSFGFSVSHTTRKPRPGETNGVHYHFTDKEVMQKLVADGQFIESALYGGNMYGTSKQAVQAVCDNGKVCVLDIDVQGVKEVKKTDLKPWFVFVEPPSLSALEERLKARNTETPESLQVRLQVASDEMEYGRSEGNFHKVITNDDLDEAYQTLKAFLESNLLKAED